VTWPQRLWNFDRPYRWKRVLGAVTAWGYNAPASAGAALANARHGRLSVSIQGDGDLMYAPGTLWTCAHHPHPDSVRDAQQPRLSPGVHVPGGDGRAAWPRRPQRPHRHTLTDPDIDFATVAKGFGVYAEGPITDPNDLGPALARAVAIVERGEPALVDVITDPR